MSILTKRLYETQRTSDGKRILIDRLWPRGWSKPDPRIDVWVRDVAPSTALRKWYAHEPSKWVEFKRRYHKELDDNPEAVAELRRQIQRRRVTFLFASKEEKLNNATALKEYLEKGARR